MGKNYNRYYAGSQTYATGGRKQHMPAISAHNQSCVGIVITHAVWTIIALLALALFLYLPTLLTAAADSISRVP